MTCPVLTEALARGGPKGRAQATITGRVLSPLDPDTVLLGGRKPRKRTHQDFLLPAPPPPARRPPPAARGDILPGLREKEKPSPARRARARHVPTRPGFRMELQSQRSRFSVCVPRVAPGSPPGFGRVTVTGVVCCGRRSAAGRRWAEVDVAGGGLCTSWSVAGSSYASHLPPPCPPPCPPQS